MQNFELELEKVLAERVGTEYSIRFMNVIKNNDTIKRSVNILKDNDKCTANIYIEGYFKAYSQNTMSMDEIVDEIVGIYQNNKGLNDAESNDLMNQLSSYETCKESLFFRLVNMESNGEFLKNKVYLPFNDLAMVLYLRLGCEEEAMCSVAINQNIYDSWNIDISKEDFFKQVLENTEKQNPCKIKNLFNVMMELLGDEADMNDVESKMYVLTNTSGINGAIAMMYKGVLKELAEKKNVSELIIIPSSIHESLVIVKDNNDTYKKADIQAMVNEVNNTQVLPEEVLSYNVYLYTRDNDEIVIWEE